MDSVRISHHPNWNGIKDDDDNEIMFCSVPFRSDKDWNEVKVIDVKDNLKQIAKPMNIVQNRQKTVNCI